MALEKSSPKLDMILNTATNNNANKIDKTINSIFKRFNFINKNSKNFNTNLGKSLNQFQKMDKITARMQKQTNGIASNMRIAGLALKGFIVGKALGGFKDIVAQYGSTGAEFSAAKNKSNVKNDLALSRALELNTGSTYQSLQDTLGKLASNANIQGSEEQKILTQAGFNPAEFAKLSNIDRLNTLVKSFDKIGNNKAFRDIFESLTGLSASELEGISKNLESINKDYKTQSDNLKGIDSKSLSKTNYLFGNTFYKIQDVLANLSSKIAPALNNLLDVVIKTIEKFINGGGIEKIGKTFKNAFKWLSDPKTLDSITEGFKTLIKVVSSVCSAIEWLIDKCIDLAGMLKNFGLLVFESFQLIFNNILLAIEKIKSKFSFGENKEITRLEREIKNNKANISTYGQSYVKNTDSLLGISSKQSKAPIKINIQNNIKSNDVTASFINNSYSKVTR